MSTATTSLFEHPTSPWRGARFRQCGLGTNGWPCRWLLLSVFVFSVFLGWGMSGRSLASEIPPGEVSFDRDVAAILTKAGCNAGACHGAAAGRGGFRLSLYGSRPEFDYRAIVREQQGRRVDLQRPDMSLVLRKPTGDLEHGGGDVLDPDGLAAQQLVRWIEQGAGRKVASPLERFELTVAGDDALTVGATIRIDATATFRGEPRRNVTAWTVLTADDESSLRIDPHKSTVTLLRPGRHLVLGRYLDQTVPLELLVPFVAASTESTPRETHGENVVDVEVDRALAALNVKPSKLARDEAFLRRVTIDLAGRLPTLDEQREFPRRRRFKAAA